VLSGVVSIEKLLEPLQELEVVLESALYETIDGNDLKIEEKETDGNKSGHCK